MKKNRIMIIIIILFSLVLLLILCAIPKNRYENALHKIGGKNITTYTLIAELESHGGFLNDGTTYYAFEKLDPVEMMQMISDQPRWRELSEFESIGSFLYHGTGDIQIPEINIERGYVYFYDDQNPKVYYSETDLNEVFSRYSHNYIIALLDIDHNTLYYVKADS
ncbi:MAG: hypothetical protein J6I50_05440 [Clostridia bacterium]|nr:hypothetical protein [Clostridia bacterium]